MKDVVRTLGVMNKTLPAGHLGITELEALEKNIRAALESPRVKYVMPPRTALQLVETAKAALMEAGQAAANYVGDADFIVDLSWRLKNVRRAFRSAAKVRIPKRLAKEPAVLRLRAIAARALDWDDDAEDEMVSEFGYGLERMRPSDSLDEFDAEAPKVGDEFEDRFGSHYRVTGYDDEECYVLVELIKPARAVELGQFLTYSQLTNAQREAKLKASGVLEDDDE